MLETQYRTTLECPGTLAQSWAPSWLSESPKSPETPAIIEENEPDESEIYYPDLVDLADFDALNDFYWSQLTDHDREYLTSPRESADPCPWCGGRTRHNPACDELRASWEVCLPFGKWKGKPLSQVPADYLAWLTGSSDSLDNELRDAIQRRLSA